MKAIFVKLPTLNVFIYITKENCALVAVHNKKLIRRWNSERELFCDILHVLQSRLQ